MANGFGEFAPGWNDENLEIIGKRTALRVLVMMRDDHDHLKCGPRNISFGSQDEPRVIGKANT